MLTPRAALTVILMEHGMVDSPGIAVSIGGVCDNTQGSFDCE